MKPKNVLITVFARAAWGGLHENVLYEAQALAKSGFRVWVACSESRLAVRLRLVGAKVIVVDWNQMDQASERVLRAAEFDLIHAHPFLSRTLALEVKRIQGCPLLVSMHGNYLDYANQWVKLADHIFCVSEALRDSFLAQVKDSVPSRVSVLPNGVNDEVFERPLVGLDEKLSAEYIYVVMASRLDPDKQPLVDAAVNTISNLKSVFPNREIRFMMLGNGSDSDRHLKTISALGVEVEFVEWTMSEKVVDILARAVVSICPGRSAAQSLAVGTPVVAAGSQGTAGLQVGSQLNVGWWSNFGGFPVQSATNSDSFKSLFVSSESYAKVQRSGREFMECRAKQSHLDKILVTHIDLILQGTN